MKKTLKSLLRKGVLIASTGLSCLIGIGGCITSKDPSKHPNKSQEYTMKVLRGNNSNEIVKIPYGYNSYGYTILGSEEDLGIILGYYIDKERNRQRDFHFCDYEKIQIFKKVLIDTDTNQDKVLDYKDIEESLKRVSGLETLYPLLRAMH